MLMHAPPASVLPRPAVRGRDGLARAAGLVSGAATGVKEGVATGAAGLAASSETRIGTDHSARAAQAALLARIAARAALRSLYAELCLYPKPGLVSKVDSGSHQDMDAATFMRSLFSLRHYFQQITLAGIADADFSTLRELGIAAEARMLAATGGVNTHRGAIFCLGLLCAAWGRAQAHAHAGAHAGTQAGAHAGAHAGAQALSACAVRNQLRQRWGPDLAQHLGTPGSHGAQVWARYSVAGARQQAAHGLPAVFELALPRLRSGLQQGRPWDGAALDTLFALMAHLSDSNVLYRAGWRGMQLVQQQAARFLQHGGSSHPLWQQHALECHRVLVAQRISPGGAADLFSATCLMHFLLPWPERGG
jgi:triphosphoribosyl-dephospho-CoA synthase